MSIQAEMYGGPFDGREFELPQREPFLRVPIPPSEGVLPGTQTTVLVAFYARVDTAFPQPGDKLRYQYVREERL